jgi:hypothetical protein
MFTPCVCLLFLGIEGCRRRLGGLIRRVRRLFGEAAGDLKALAIEADGMDFVALQSPLYISDIKYQAIRWTASSMRLVTYLDFPSLTIGAALSGLLMASSHFVFLNIWITAHPCPRQVKS